MRGQDAKGPPGCPEPMAETASMASTAPTAPTARRHRRRRRHQRHPRHRRHQRDERRQRRDDATSTAREALANAGLRRERQVLRRPPRSPAATATLRPRDGRLHGRRRGRQPGHRHQDRDRRVDRQAGPARRGRVVQQVGPVHLPRADRERLGDRRLAEPGRHHGRPGLPREQRHADRQRRRHVHVRLRDQPLDRRRRPVDGTPITYEHNRVTACRS